MIQWLPESEGNVLVFQATGKLTDEDYQNVWIPQLEAVIRQYGKARVVMDMSEDFHGWKIAALWDDFCFGIAHRNDFEKMSVVGGSQWVEWGTKLAQLFINGEVKCFPANARDEAVAWIKEREPAMV